MTKSHIDQLSAFIVSVAQEKQAEQITVVTMNNPVLVDQIILMTAKNGIHMKAVAEYISLEAKKQTDPLNSPDFYEFPKTIGDVESGWIVLDLNSIAVHILLEDTRSFYDLDGLFEKRGVVFHP